MLCLQHLRRYAGRKFIDLLADDAMKRKFESFLKGSGAATNGGAPRCIRVALKATAGYEIPVDVFHVRLPRLHGDDTVHHLLAITGDADSQPRPEAQEDAIPSSLLSRAPSRGSLSEASSQSEAIEFYDESWLLLQVNIELARKSEAQSPRAVYTTT